ncbi:MAG: alpha/beta hydrolase [Gemmatimonadales bacterium]
MMTVRFAFLLLPLVGTVPAAARQQATRSIRTENKAVRLPNGDSLHYSIGFLTVPENRRDPKSRLIEVAFLRLPATGGASGPPLIYLAGGPGNTAVTENPGALAGWTPERAVGDVILLDQRGTGRSRPNLIYRWTGPLPLQRFLDADHALAAIRQIAGDAARHFRDEGVDLAGYTTEQSADDVDDLRAALGADRMNLVGFSYGTHLALAVIRRHGSRVNRAVLTGVEGPDHTEKLPVYLDTQWRKLCLMAAADSAIAARIPDLDALLRRVLARLEREPMVVTLTDPRTREPLQVPVGPHGLLLILRADIGDASDLPVFPRLLYSIDRGDPALLTWFVTKRSGLGWSSMTAMMDAASGASPARKRMIADQQAVSLFADAANFPGTAAETGLAVPDLEPDYRSPVVSPVPVLFLSGTLDWNAPPFQAEEVRFGFPNSSHIVVRNAGHEQIMSHPAVIAAARRFLAGASVDDATASLPPLRFVPVEGYDPGRTHPSVPRPR